MIAGMHGLSSEVEDDLPGASSDASSEQGNIRTLYAKGNSLPGHLFGSESTPPRRALLLCGLDSSIAVLDALGSVLGDEPGWIVGSAGVSLPGNPSSWPLTPSRRESDIPVNDARYSFVSTLKGCIDSIPAWVDSLAGYSRCRDIWICGFGIMATAAVLALSDGSLGRSGALDASRGSIDITGLACVGMEAPFGSETVRSDSEEAPTDHDEVRSGHEEGLSYREEADTQEYSDLLPRDSILQAVQSIDALSSLVIIHGLDDRITSPDYVRRVVGACPSAKADSLRLLGGAGHDLYADPRVVALLTGWMDRGPM